MRKSDLQKTRLCAGVVLACGSGDGTTAIESAVAALRGGLGSNWSHVTAFQYMAGKRAKFALECGPPEEKATLLLAHQYACLVCAEEKLGPANAPDDLDLAELRALFR